MHPPILPNPSGDGLLFYEKQEPFRNAEVEEHPFDKNGTVIASNIISRVEITSDNNSKQLHLYFLSFSTCYVLTNTIPHILICNIEDGHYMFTF